MTRRRRPLGAALVAAVAVGLVQLAFTIGVDPHVVCDPGPEVATALADAGLAPQERCLSDATAYHLLGRGLADSGAYLRPFDRAVLGVDRPTAEYPPLCPFALSLLDRVGIDSVAGQQAVLGTLLAALTAAGLVAIARRLGLGPVAATAAGVAVAAQPLLLQANALLMTEGLFAAAVTGVVLLALVHRERPSVARAAALGAALGAAALVRGEGLIWIPIAVALVAVATPTRRGRQALVVVALAGAVVVPWTARNAARFDELVPVSNNLGTVLDGANCDLTYAGPTIGAWRSTFVPGSTDRDRPCFAGFAIEDPGFSEAAAAADARREGLEYATSHVGRWPAVAVARLGRTFGVWNPDQQVDLEVLEGRVAGWQWAGTVVWWATIPLAALGARRLGRRDRSALLLVALPLLGVVVTTLVTYGNQRFRAGLDPIALLLAVAGVEALVTSRRRDAPAVDPGP